MKTKDLILKEKPTLSDLQDYVKEVKSTRGFTNDPNKSFILLNKEVGELAQAFRFAWTDESISQEESNLLKQELADVFFYVLDIANQFGVSLEESFRSREDINKNRTWKKHHFN